MIKTSPLGTCLTIVFLNKTHEPPTPTVWVCANREAYDRGLDKLRAMKHIEIVGHGDTHVEG